MIFVMVGHAAATLFMVGVIWFVQIVHYPLMNRVGDSCFTQYELINVRRTGWVVGPVMLAEGVTAFYLVWVPATRSPAALAGLGLLFLIWASTAFIELPCHRHLSEGFNPAVHRRLVNSNWIRTIAWTLRGALSLLILGYGV
jgi:hypothetical protein